MEMINEARRMQEMQTSHGIEELPGFMQLWRSIELYGNYTGRKIRRLQGACLSNQREEERKINTDD